MLTPPFIFLKTLKSLSDFQLPFPFILNQISYLFCFRMLVFLWVLWNFYLNTNLKWGFVFVFVFLLLIPRVIPLYMIARAFLSHCLRLRVSVPPLISCSEPDYSSVPFSVGVLSHYNEKVELQISSCMKFFTDFSFDPLLHSSHWL